MLVMEQMLSVADFSDWINAATKRRPL